MSKKKYYSPEFKEEAVRLAESSGNKSKVARDLGIHATMIGKWQRDLQAEGRKVFPGHGRPRDEEMLQLKRDNRRLQQEVEILKKAVAGTPVGIFTVRS
jgi:transposase